MRAEQIFFAYFDRRFFALSAEVQRQIGEKVDEMGRDLASFPHYQMTGSDRFRLLVGDYRIIYKYDVLKNEIYLLDVGHRSQIYR